MSESPLNFNYRVHAQTSWGLSMNDTVWMPRISPRRQSVCWSPAKKDLLSHSGVAVKPYFSPGKWCNGKFWEHNGKSTLWGTREKEKTCTKPMVYLTTLQQYHHNHIMHVSSMLGTLDCSVTWLVIYCSGSLFASPQRKMHVVKECQDNRAYSKSGES